MTEEQILASLQSLARANGVAGGVEVTGLRRVRGGNSSEIWALDGRWDAGDGAQTRPLILRSGADNEFTFHGRGLEHAVLKALEPTPVETPAIYWFDPDGAHFDRQTMIMERRPGIAERGVLTDRNTLGLDLGQRVSLGQSMIDQLAALHRIAPPPGDFGGDGSAEQRLRAHDNAIAGLELEPVVELHIASWWLWRHLPPPPSRRTIVHGDYRPANMLVQDGRISAILDWEFVGVGDPLEDLGWYLSPYYARDHLIPGAFTRNDVIARYEAASGASVDRAAVTFWGVFAIYKLAYMTMAALRWMTEGDASRMTVTARFILQPLLEAIAAADKEAAA